MTWMKLGASMLLALGLAACGGGGDDTSASGSGNSAGNNNPAPSGLSQYAGTWDPGCVRSDDVSKGGQPAYERLTIVATPEGQNLNLAITTRIYEPTNTTCSGAASATHQQTGKVVNKGSQTVTLNGVSLTGQQVDLTLNPIGAGLSAGGTITLNGFVYPGNFFTRSETDFSWYIVQQNGQIYINDKSTFDADVDPFDLIK